MKGKQNNNRRGSKRKQVVVFNPDERADYITGFRKRKAQRRKDAQDQIKAKAEEELKDIRREVRAEQHWPARREALYCPAEERKGQRTFEGL